MITVTIHAASSLVALCTITGSPDEFQRDLARIKHIPYEDRFFVRDIEPNYWRVRNAARYAAQIVEIREAISDYKRQLKFL
jgi:hypothetical protein